MKIIITIANYARPCNIFVVVHFNILFIDFRRHQLSNLQLESKMSIKNYASLLEPDFMRLIKSHAMFGPN